GGVGPLQLREAVPRIADVRLVDLWTIEAHAAGARPRELVVVRKAGADIGERIAPQQRLGRRLEDIPERLLVKSRAVSIFRNCRRRERKEEAIPPIRDSLLGIEKLRVAERKRRVAVERYVCGISTVWKCVFANLIIAISKGGREACRRRSS